MCELPGRSNWRRTFQGKVAWRTQKTRLLSLWKNLEWKFTTKFGKKLSFTEFTQYILRNGTNEEKREIATVFGRQLYLHNKEICGSPLR